MKRIRYVVASAVCALTLGASRASLALGSIADVSIIDRDTGAVLTTYYCRGEYWVAGNPGARYAIAVRNRLGERILAVTAVDGVNVVTGATAAWDQSGYVFGPAERYLITGWRKSESAVAAFTFTDASRSYAQLTGRPANVGVIGVALFRERQAPAVYAPPPDSQRSQAGAADSAAASAAAPPKAAAPLASNAERSRAEMAPPMPAPKLGTGHGEREQSYVTLTEFERAQEQPNEVIRIRYDSLDNLVAMGIIRHPRPLPAGVNPFPGSPVDHYVPDPPG